MNVLQPQCRIVLMSSDESMLEWKVPSPKDCTVLQTAPMTSKSHRSILWKMVVEQCKYASCSFNCVCVCVWFKSLYSTMFSVGKIHCGRVDLRCFSPPAYLQRGKYSDIHFLTEVTRV